MESIDLTVSLLTKHKTQLLALAQVRSRDPPPFQDGSKKMTPSIWENQGSVLAPGSETS